MNLSDHIERACELVVRALFPRGSMNDAQFKAWIGGWLSGRDLFHRIDAWRRLWERMGELGLLHAQELMEIVDPTVRLNEHGMYELITGELYLLMLAQPHHHLEAALRTLEDTCPDCEGSGSLPQTLPDPDGEPCTCNDGKRTLYDILTRDEPPEPEA